MRLGVGREGSTIILFALSLFFPSLVRLCLFVLTLCESEEQLFGELCATKPVATAMSSQRPCQAELGSAYLMFVAFHSPQCIQMARGSTQWVLHILSPEQEVCYAVHPLPTELNTLQEELMPFNVSILGFPCNQFGKQEPGKNSEILLGLK